MKSSDSPCPPSSSTAINGNSPANNSSSGVKGGGSGSKGSASKDKKKSKSSIVKPISSFDDQEFILQAVVIGDSFNERFMPITLDKPRCLLPLVNIPLIEYTFECLATSGVQEVFLLVHSHADQIKQYISKSRWGRKSTFMQINVIALLDCSSVGEALRECDCRSLLRGPDFLLVHGDLVSNINLSPIINQHRTRRRMDKGLLMTMMLKKMNPFHRTRERGESAIFILSPPAGHASASFILRGSGTAARGDNSKTMEDESRIAMERISSGGSMSLLQKNSANYSIMDCIGYELPDRDLEIDPKMILQNNRNVNIRYDLMDCQVDICSMQVLALMTENFDYQDLRKDFLRGILDSDILKSSHRVSCHIVYDGYASRVRTPHLYDSTSRDILERWAWPLVPEADIIADNHIYCTGHEVYLSSDTIISRNGVSISSQSLIGSGTFVGDHTVIKKSVIGPNCHIGSGVHLDNAYIWEGVKIESGCTITSSIISDKCTIRHGTVIEPGCLITSNVIIGPRVTIPSNTRIAKYTDHFLQVATPTIGSYPTDDPAILSQQSQEREGPLGIGSDGIIWTGSFQQGENGEEYQDNPAWNIGSDAYHLSIPLTKSDAIREEVTPQSDVNFYQSAMELLNGTINSCDWDNIALEINALKFAHNASLYDCVECIVETLYSMDYGWWTKAAPLLHKFVKNHNDQLFLLEQLQDRNDLGRIIPLLYKLDILEEDSILNWNDNNAHPNDQLKEFIQWLKEAESESSSSE